jgi:hypothetical protein
MSELVPYWCNRGIGIYGSNNSIVCFCPPQYYGDKCQYHNDRLTVLIRLNLSQSVYIESKDRIEIFDYIFAEQSSLDD